MPQSKTPKQLEEAQKKRSAEVSNLVDSMTSVTTNWKSHTDMLQAAALQAGEVAEELKSNGIAVPNYAALTKNNAAAAILSAQTSAVQSLKNEVARVAKITTAAGNIKDALLKLEKELKPDIKKRQEDNKKLKRKSSAPEVKELAKIQGVYDAAIKAYKALEDGVFAVLKLETFDPAAENKDFVTNANKEIAKSKAEKQAAQKASTEGQKTDPRHLAKAKAQIATLEKAWTGKSGKVVNLVKSGGVAKDARPKMNTAIADLKKEGDKVAAAIGKLAEPSKKYLSRRNSQELAKLAKDPDGKKLLEVQKKARDAVASIAEWKDKLSGAQKHMALNEKPEKAPIPPTMKAQAAAAAGGPPPKGPLPSALRGEKQ
ncbi:MAG: hypothetical protein AAF393_06425 [Pseudomonadota bacterium]